MEGSIQHFLCTPREILQQARPRGIKVVGIEQSPFPSKTNISSLVFSCSADGNYEVTLMTKATVYYTGLVVWQPPAVYKSSCSIDVEFFPYDVQTCVLKLGSWTYDGFKVTFKTRSEKCCLVCSCLENCRSAPCT